jgi:hypothetical protein
MMIVDFLTDQVFITVLIASLICQTWKVVDKTARNSRFEWGYFIDAGGMPSSHSTFVCSLALSIGFVEGFASSVFFLAAGFAIIVVRDAFGVRQAVDKLNQTVTAIIREKKLSVKHFLEVTGHTPVQAMVGTLLGIVIAVLFEVFVY